jgi:hypothetical protein
VAWSVTVSGSNLPPKGRRCYPCVRNKLSPICRVAHQAFAKTSHPPFPKLLDMCYGGVNLLVWETPDVMLDQSQGTRLCLSRQRAQDITRGGRPMAPAVPFLGSFVPPPPVISDGSVWRRVVGLRRGRLTLFFPRRFLQPLPASTAWRLVSPLGASHQIVVGRIFVRSSTYLGAASPARGRSWLCWIMRLFASIFAWLLLCRICSDI